MLPLIYIALNLAFFSTRHVQGILCDHGLLGRLGSGVIRSYNFPFDYRHNLTCHYRIYLNHQPASMKTICFTFHRFQLESSTPFCSFDYLKFSTIKYCGSGAWQYGTQPDKTANVWSKDFCWIGKGDYFEILFSTDNNINGLGFYATYTIQEGAVTDFPATLTPSNTAPCAPDEWTCFNRRCISINDTCNGVDNCGDGSDESFTHARCGEQNVLACDFSAQGGISDGYCGFTQDGGQWYRTNNAAGTHGTTGDHTNGTHGYYVYTDVDNKPSYLVSPQITLPPSVTHCLSFWYFVYGTRDSASLNVYLDQESIGSKSVWSRRGHEENSWLMGQVLLEGLSTLQLTFEAKLVNSFSGVALDDISILPGQCVDDDISCNFELNTCGWTSVNHLTSLNANLQWTRATGAVPDTSSETKDGYYLSVGATELAPQEHRALLVSPSVSGLHHSKHCLHFNYRMSGSRDSCCMLRVMLHESDGILGTAAWSQHGSERDQWKTASVEFDMSTPFQVVLEAVITQGSNGRVMVDQVLLLPSACHDQSSGACKPSQYLCLSGECIDPSRKCDGVRDCRDGSDEHQLAGCPAPSSPSDVTCRPNEFQCHSDKQCVSNIYKCDNFHDCSDGSDEGETAGCPQGKSTLHPNPCDDGEFHCENDQCIPGNQRCDGRDDCGDGSDENSCHGSCGADQFQCASDKTCISAVKKCDSHADCLDGSDESYNVAGCAELKPGGILGTGGIIGICIGALIVVLVVLLALFLCRRRKMWCKQETSVSRNTTMSTISYPDTLNRRHPAGSFPNSYIDPDLSPGAVSSPDQEELPALDNNAMAVPRSYINANENGMIPIPLGDPPPPYDVVAKEPGGGLQRVAMDASVNSTPPSYRSTTPPNHRSVTPINHFRPIMPSFDRATPVSYRSNTPICDISAPLHPIVEHVSRELNPPHSAEGYEAVPEARQNGDVPRSHSAESYLYPVSHPEHLQLRPLPPICQPPDRSTTTNARSRAPMSASLARLSERLESASDSENPYATIDDVHSADSQTPLHDGTSSSDSSTSGGPTQAGKHYASVDIINQSPCRPSQSFMSHLSRQPYHQAHTPMQMSDPVSPWGRTSETLRSPVRPELSPLSLSFDQDRPYPFRSHSAQREPCQNPNQRILSNNPRHNQAFLNQPSTSGGHFNPHGLAPRRSVPSLGVSGRRGQQRVQYRVDLGNDLVASDV